MKRRRRRNKLLTPLKKEKVIDRKKDHMDTFHLVMVSVYFISCILLLNTFSQIELSFFELIQLYCLFLGLSFLVPIKLYRKALTISYYEYLFFNILSVAPVLIFLTFEINEQFKGETYIETYPIINKKGSESKTVFTLEGNAYKNQEYMRSISNKENIEIMGSQHLAIYLSDGFLGIRIIEKKRIY